MIVKPNVLDRAHLPERLHHREREQAQLVRVLTATDNRNVHESILISGPPGTGKTVCTLTALSEVAAETTTSTVVLQAGIQTTTEALAKIIDNHPEGKNVDADHSEATLAARLEELISTPYIVVFNSVDPGHTREAIELLESIGFISVITLTRSRPRWVSARGDNQDEQVFDHQMRFQPYSQAELIDILEQRAVQAVELSCWSQPILKRIAEKAGGNAMTAIRLFKTALHLATQREHDTVLRRDVTDAAVETLPSSLSESPY